MLAIQHIGGACVRSMISFARSADTTPKRIGFGEFRVNRHARRCGGHSRNRRRHDGAFGMGLAPAQRDRGP